jgi:cytochrome P450
VSTTLPGPVPVHELDLPDAPMADPAHFEPLANLREPRPDSWLTRTMFGYGVHRYEDVQAVLRDRRWHSAASRIAEMSGITDPDYLSRRRESILSAEGDVHTRLRRLVAPAFTPRAADRLRPVMRDVVHRLVDDFAATGEAELVADLCEPYPIPIICTLLGAPERDWQLFSRWATDVLRVFDGNLVEDLPVITLAMDELQSYTVDLIAQRRDLPADDLLTDLIAVEEEGERLTTDELVRMVEAVIVGGTDTTRNPRSADQAIALIEQSLD